MQNDLFVCPECGVDLDKDVVKQILLQEMVDIGSIGGNVIVPITCVCGETLCAEIMVRVQTEDEVFYVR